jgi:hypothetical protein
MEGTMKENDFEWSVKIIRVENGFIINRNTLPDEGDSMVQDIVVVQAIDDDFLSAGREMFFELMDFFDLWGSKHDDKGLKISVVPRDEMYD